MAAYLTSSFTRRHSTILPENSSTKVRSLIHDHESFIRLNPVVTWIELSSTQNTPFPLPPNAPQPAESKAQETWKTYNVIDEIPRLGGLWTQKVVYTNALCSTENGMKGVTNPGLGVHIEGSWVVERDAEGREVLVETIWVECPIILVPLIRFAMGSSHDVVHRRILEIVSGEGSTGD